LIPLLVTMTALLALSGRLLLLALVFPLLACAVVLVGIGTKTWLSSSVPAFLGRISCTLYMVHIAALAIVCLVVGNISGSVIGKSIAIVLATALKTTVERWEMWLR